MSKENDLAGRSDSKKQIKEYFSNFKHKVDILSISGAGGIGKSFLFDNVYNEYKNNEKNINFLELKISGNLQKRESIDVLLSRNLIESSKGQIDFTKGYFYNTKLVSKKISDFNESLKNEIKKQLEEKNKDTSILDDFLFQGIRILANSGAKKLDVDLDDEAKEIITKASKKFLEDKDRVFRGIMPDFFGTTKENEIRKDPLRVISNALIEDITIILYGWNGIKTSYFDKISIFLKPSPEKINGLDNLILIIDDYESMQDHYNSFLLDSFIDNLLNSKFNTKIVILGRDKLSNTNTSWDQKFKKYITKEIHLDRFTEAESKEYLNQRNITNENDIDRIINETKNIPYLLSLECDFRNDKGFSALNLSLFFDRTTKWMNSKQKDWIIPLSFLNKINIPNIKKLLPNEDSKEVFNWFEKESSIRDPNSKEWSVLPFISGKIKDYIENKDPDEFEKYQNIVKNILL